MTENQKYLFDKLFSRLDFYLNSLNVKAAFIVAFDTFVLSTLILKYNEIISSLHHCITVKLVVSIFALLLCSISASLIFVFMAIKPFLESGETESYRSLFFFKSVSDMGIEEFQKRATDLNDDTLVKDVIRQTYTLACGATVKFQYMERAVFTLIFLIILPLSLLYLIKIIDWFL